MATSGKVFLTDPTEDTEEELNSTQYVLGKLRIDDEPEIKVGLLARRKKEVIAIKCTQNFRISQRSSLDYPVTPDVYDYCIEFDWFLKIKRWVQGLGVIQEKMSDFFVQIEKDMEGYDDTKVTRLTRTYRAQEQYRSIVRKKLIDTIKNSEAYRNYSALVSKERRKPELKHGKEDTRAQPLTPDSDGKYSELAWSAAILEWNRLLSDWEDRPIVTTPSPRSPGIVL